MSLEDRTGTTGSAPSILSPDLKIVGNLESDGEIQIDGTVKGDIKGHMLKASHERWHGSYRSPAARTR